MLSESIGYMELKDMLYPGSVLANEEDLVKMCRFKKKTKIDLGSTLHGLSMARSFKMRVNSPPVAPEEDKKWNTDILNMMDVEDDRTTGSNDSHQHKHHDSHSTHL